MGRPSQIELTLHVRDGVLDQAWIGGDAVVISHGEIDA